MRPRISLLQLCNLVSQVRALKSQSQGFFECSFRDPLPGAQGSMGSQIGLEDYGKLLKAESGSLCVQLILL